MRFFLVRSADTVVLRYVSLLFISFAIVVAVIVIMLFFLAVLFCVFHFSFCSVVAIVKSAMFESHLRSFT